MSTQWQVFFFGLQWGRLLLPNGGVFEGPYCWSITSSIVGPSLDSVLPITILSMDAAMILRYMALVKSSQMILPAFILETLDVILPTADTSVEVLPSGHMGSNVSVLTMVLTKLWGQCSRLPYCQCSGGQKHWYGGSSW